MIVGGYWFTRHVNTYKARSWISLASPAQDRPLVPAVERFSRQLRQTAAALSDHAVPGFPELYSPKFEGLGFKISENDLGLRSAWVLIGEWLVAWAVGFHDGGATIGQTHAWFWGNRTARPLPPPLQDFVVSSPPATRREVHALLPYLLDPTAVGTRRDVLRERVQSTDREARKRSGVYYTPGDVTAYMVDRLLATRDGRAATTWLDLAHGSGAFLRSVLSLSPDPGFARNNLYGIDIDSYAAEATSFVLTAEDILLNVRDDSPGVRWHHFRKNLATANSLLLSTGGPGETMSLWEQPGVTSVEAMFPEIGSQGFSRVIANPPYAKLASPPEDVSLEELFPITGGSLLGDVSPAFLELGSRLLSSKGAMCMVLPLSHVTSSRRPFPALRSYLADQQGLVQFESYDRMPDALFGDDIKTRNSIILVDRTASNEICTTSLQRWTSRRRDQLFSEISRVDVTGVPGSPNLLPKIGTEWERDLYLCSRDHEVTVGDWVQSRKAVPIQQAQTVDSSHWSQLIAIAPTAYNFLGVTRDPSQSVRDGHNSSSASSLLRFDSAQSASAAYALLSSHFAFWLWHVTGDGFHVSSRLPWSIPAPTDNKAIERLADLGMQLWQQAKHSPVISKNRGRITLSYPTWMYGDLLAQIDHEVDEAFGTSSAALLVNWHKDLMVVDSESERSGIVSRKAK